MHVSPTASIECTCACACACECVSDSSFVFVFVCLRGEVVCVFRWDNLRLFLGSLETTLCFASTRLIINYNIINI